MKHCGSPAAAADERGAAANEPSNRLASLCGVEHEHPADAELANLRRERTTVVPRARDDEPDPVESGRDLGGTTRDLEVPRDDHAAWEENPRGVRDQPALGERERLVQVPRKHDDGLARRDSRREEVAGLVPVAGVLERLHDRRDRTNLRNAGGKERGEGDEVCQRRTDAATPAAPPGELIDRSGRKRRNRQQPERTPLLWFAVRADEGHALREPDDGVSNGRQCRARADSESENAARQQPRTGAVEDGARHHSADDDRRRQRPPGGAVGGERKSPQPLAPVPVQADEVDEEPVVVTRRRTEEREVGRRNLLDGLVRTVLLAEEEPQCRRNEQEAE